MAKPQELFDQAKAFLQPGESVEAWVSGTYEGKIGKQKITRTAVFLATDRRLVFYAKKLGGHDLESFYYENISSFEQAKNFMGHSFRFFASGNQVDMKWINDTQAFTAFADLLARRAGQRPSAAPAAPVSAPVQHAAPAAAAPALAPPVPAASPAPAAAPVDQGDPFEALEKLGRLRDAGIVTPEEFEAKKAEILKRI